MNFCVKNSMLEFHARLSFHRNSTNIHEFPVLGFNGNSNDVTWVMY